jgi:subtilase family serine protease
LSGYPQTAKKIIARASVLLLAFVLGVSGFGVFAPRAAAATNVDLIVQDITLSPQDPVIGETVTITVAIKNQGSDGVGLNYVACYMDSAVLDTKDIFSIAPGATKTIDFTWTAEKGSHVVKAIADAIEAIAETNETNNTRTFNFSTLAPDLAIQSASWSPQNPSKGDNIAFTVTVKNQGTTASTLTDIFLYVDGYSRDSEAVEAINPGETVTYTLNWIASEGQHTVRVVVDKGDYVKESDETNNEQTFPFSTLSPDLVVLSVTWSPENPSRNDQVTCIAAVKNQGGGRADSCTLAYYVNDIYVSSISVGSLAAGATSYYTFTLTILADTQSLKLFVDSTQKIAESDEMNNEYSAIIATASPDLIVKDITWTPQDAGIGDVLTFTITVKNQGNGRAVASRAAYYVGGVYCGSLSIPQLEPGDEATKSFQWTAEFGSVTVMVAVDADNAINESHESNNMMTKTIPIAQADLTVDNITWLPVNPAIDETVVFTVSVKNMGGGKASLYNVGYYIDDTLVGSDLVYATDGGDTSTTTFEWQAQNGRHVFKAVADYTKHTTEINENNNEFSVTVVPFMPDLAISTVAWSPLEIQADVEMTFDIIVLNIGSLRAGTSRLSFYIDGELVGFTYIGSLDPGAAATEHFTWVATAGSHQIDIVADASNQILEIDEDNNTKVVSLPPPDLTVQNIAVTPPDAAIGDTMVITATIKNQGNSKTQKSLVTLYVDGSFIDSQDLPPIDVGGTADVPYEWIAEPGTHTVRVVTDIENTVIESDEVNNDKEMEFSVLTPDLIVQDFFWETNNDVASNEINITITVKNIGTGTAGSNQLEYYFDDTTTLTEEIPEIPPGETAEISFTTILASGAHMACFTADFLDDIAELDEYNNQGFFSFDTVVPDLIVRTITWSPLDAHIGDEITIIAKVENQGVAKAIEPHMTLFIDGIEADSADIPEIDVDSTADAEFIWTITEGQHEITVIANSDNAVMESNLTNNAKSRSLSFENATAPVKKNAGLPVVSVGNKGFLTNWWWVLLMIAALLGVGAFFTAMKAVRKKSQ